jgi:hypothetical protein
MITKEEMLDKLDEVAEMSDMIGNPAALTKDDMWPGVGDFTPKEIEVLHQAVADRFGCSVVELRAAVFVKKDFQTALLDKEGYALYVLVQDDGHRILAIGQPGYDFDAERELTDDEKTEVVVQQVGQAFAEGIREGQTAEQAAQTED